jgi:hypothetical protein
MEVNQVSNDCCDAFLKTLLVCLPSCSLPEAVVMLFSSMSGTLTRTIP